MNVFIVFIFVLIIIGTMIYAIEINSPTQPPHDKDIDNFIKKNIKRY